MHRSHYRTNTCCCRLCSRPRAIRPGPAGGYFPVNRVRFRCEAIADFRRRRRRAYHVSLGDRNRALIFGRSMGFTDNPVLERTFCRLQAPGGFDPIDNSCDSSTGIPHLTRNRQGRKSYGTSAAGIGPVGSGSKCCSCFCIIVISANATTTARKAAIPMNGERLACERYSRLAHIVPTYMLRSLRQ